MSRLQFYCVCTIFPPLILAALAVAYAVTLLLDLTSGPILDVSFESMTHILVHIIVILCGLSVGLRSESLLSALEVFVAFTFKIDMMAQTKRNSSIALQMTATFNFFAILGIVRRSY